MEVNRSLPLLLLCFCLLLLSAAGSSFSSRLIHRFSDEGRALWASRTANAGVGASWPRSNGSELSHVLLVNDLKRQKMKLSSPYQMMFPSEGSKTLFFGNELYWLHYTWIDIGTPNVSFLVALDSGSDLLWVPCDCIQCAPLSASYYTSLDKDLSEYTPSSSSTGKQLSCDHQLCETNSHCETSNDPCPYIRRYHSDDTSTSGFLVEDTLHLKSVDGDGHGGSVQASIIIGCGRKQSGGYLDGAAPDGLMGLGPGDISVPSLLAKAGLVQDYFSICLDENGSGRIFFGDHGDASQQSTPFLSEQGKYETYFVGVEHICVGSSCLEKSGCQAEVDTGTSFTFLPSETYDKVVLEFNKQVNAKRVHIPDSPWEYCYTARSTARNIFRNSSGKLLDVPRMRLLFALNQSFEIYNHIYSYINSQGVAEFCLTVVRGHDAYAIIGQNFISGKHLVFNREDWKLRWSNSNCEHESDRKRVHIAPGGSPNPLPTTEQQSTSNTQAVAPAVAGVASPKHSPASSVQLNSLLDMVLLFFLLIYILEP